MRTVLGSATRPDDGDQSDPYDWVRRAREPAGRHRAERHRPTVITLPSRLSGGRAGVSARAVAAVLTVVVALVAIGGVRMAWAIRDARAEIIVPDDADPSGRTSHDATPSEGESALDADARSRADPSGAAGAEDEAPRLVVVHVAGQVAQPGVVHLPEGDRVIDALHAAGGPTAAADLTSVNLARLLIDGEQIYVPEPGELVLPPASGPGGGAAGAPAPGTPIDLNTADANALISLPGVGPVLAERILDWRASHGRFTSVDELGEVSGIGDKLLAQLRDKVRV